MKKLFLLCALSAGTLVSTATDYWHKIASPVNKKLLSISFGNSLTGYICGTDSTLLKTSDGGQSWSVAGTKGMKFSPVSPDITDINFVSAETGFAVVGSIQFPEYRGIVYQTSDGGASWSESSAAIACRKTFFFDKDNGYQVGSGYFSGSNISSFRSGAWQPAAMLSAGASTFLRAVDFWDTRTGIAGGDDGIVYRTFNAGLSWDTVKTNIDTTINELHYLDEHTIIAATDHFPSALIISRDKGASWTYDITSGSFHYPAMQSVTRSSKDSLIAVGTSTTTGRGIIYTVTSGIPSLTDAEQPLYDIGMVNDSVAYIVGDSGLIVTNRAEVTAVPHFPAEPSFGFYPNPVQQLVVTQSNRKHAVFVYDQSGRLLLCDPALLSEHTLDMQCLPGGVYPARVSFEDGQVKTIQIVLQ